MIRSVFSILLVFGAFNAQAYEVTYKCSPFLQGYLNIDPVYVSIDADASDRNNKIYLIAVDDSDWVKLETDNSDSYSSVHVKISSWSDEKYEIKLQNKILSGAHKGKISYKSKSSIFPMTLRCVSSAGEHPNLKVIEDPE